MTDIPLPSPGDTSWSDWGQEQEDASDVVLSGRLSDTALRAAFVPSALPSEVAPRSGLFDGARSLYLPSGATRLRRTKAKLAAVYAGTATSRAKIVWLGHSEVAGYGATPGVSDAPILLRKLLAARYPVGTGAVVTYNNNPGTPRDSRWSVGAQWTYFGAPPGGGDAQLFVTTTTAGAAATFTSDLPGTVVDIVTFGSSAAFTYSIDGGAAVSVTPNGTSAVQVISATGLPNTTHTVTVTASTSASTYLVGAAVRPTIAAEVSNLGFYGARAADWLPDQFFNAYNTAADLAADLYLVQLDANESLNSIDPATFASNLQTVVTGLRGAGAEVALVLSIPTNQAPATWATYRAKVYDVADAASVPLVDLTDRVGSNATAQANGMLSGDSVHPSAAGYAESALAVAGLLL